MVSETIIVGSSFMNLCQKKKNVATPPRLDFGPPSRSETKQAAVAPRERGARQAEETRWPKQRRWPESMTLPRRRPLLYFDPNLLYKKMTKTEQSGAPIKPKAGSEPLLEKDTSVSVTGRLSAGPCGRH